MNSTEFEADVLNFTTHGIKTFFYRRSLFCRYIDQHYTNAQVYNMIIAADEETGANPDSIDLYLELINGADGNVAGYGNPGAKEIYTYSVMFDEMSVEELANHYTFSGVTNWDLNTLIDPLQTEIIQCLMLSGILSNYYRIDLIYQQSIKYFKSKPDSRKRYFRVGIFKTLNHDTK